MIEGLNVQPSRLRLAGGRLRASGRELSAAGRAISHAFEGGEVLRCAPLAGAAAHEFAAAVRGSVGLLVGAVDALALALDAAATRYDDTDAVVAAAVRQ